MPINPLPDNPSQIPNIRADTKKKPIIIGLYGVPGSGKTFLLKQLKQAFLPNKFWFWEGSEVISNIVEGGLDAFKKLKDAEKVEWREKAITMIRYECNNRIGVITGHFTFWADGTEAPLLVITQADLNTYTHIIYLDIDPNIVAARAEGDKERIRAKTSVGHIRKWQIFEKTELRKLCRDNGILFTMASEIETPVLDQDNDMVSKVMKPVIDQVTPLIYDFAIHNEKYNRLQAISYLDRILLADPRKLKTILLLDGDGTLVEDDTGDEFWKRFLRSDERLEKGHDPTINPLKVLFSSKMGHSYLAFRQATLLYEDGADAGRYDHICYMDTLVQSVHPDFLKLLEAVQRSENVGAVIVTCGPRRLWEDLMMHEGLSETVKVVGGGRISDGFVVTPTVKAALVDHLRGKHGVYTWGFGDSLLDLPMLKKTDQSVVVVGRRGSSSPAFDDALDAAIEAGTLTARQVSLPLNTPPRLDHRRLPPVTLTDPNFLEEIFRRRSPQSTTLTVLHATNTNAAKLLMTPTRDAKVSGPALREAHRRVGWYLATQFVCESIGLEDYPIAHVQGHETSGYRLMQEDRTTIIALMRGGEPMALGVSDAFPLAMFVHANEPKDIGTHHIKGQHTIIIIDSVINGGKTVERFVKYVWSIWYPIHIVVVAGVVHSQCLSDDGVLRRLGEDSHLTIVALRVSDNKFTGRGTTDTGNRLFNTTYLLDRLVKNERGNDEEGSKLQDSKDVHGKKA
ncbi:uncharacterized protein LY89DRAFT_651081 [Mollisia scopiformis]|uniref:Phosphoribosyltransferase domain-containing protein n=1 Tax=Mollisia scopiformis TaxID=149040 RepID=A0A194X1E4_MOLSC|nr:uncharacterized protein LY89DRAFT_651081 [Mollisia scopiformis]KUJ14013.1 hypothetical protein LY89DRAFT_651081 [Mollisia scopiformis]